MQEVFSSASNTELQMPIPHRLHHLDSLFWSSNNFTINTKFITGYSGANLKDADLILADLRWANLEGANLERANLDGAILRGTILEKR